MTTLQEAAMTAERAAFFLRRFKNEEKMLGPNEQAAIDFAIAALTQQGEQPVCAGCGIPEGDVHISTCQSGKWPLRVSNGDTATPAPVAQQGEQQPAAWLFTDAQSGDQYADTDPDVYRREVESGYKDKRPLYTAAPAPAPQPAQEQPTKVLLEHSGCGQGRQMEQLTIGLHRGDKVYKAVWECASAPLRDAMDLAYLTGQRPGDVLSFNESMIVDGVFVIKKQSKTGKPLRIRVEGEFGQLLDRIAKRKAGYKVWCSSLVINLQGLAVTKHTLRNHFEPAREAAAVANPDMADAIRAMWFYDLRAKAADDTADEHGDQAAADLLGHDNVSTTQRHYLRRGKKVGPTR